MVNINDLKKAEKLKKENKINCYNNIYHLVSNKIKLIANTNKKSTWYEIPFYIFGYPIYDVKDCSKFLIENLFSNNDFSEIWALILSISIFLFCFFMFVPTVLIFN